MAKAQRSKFIDKFSDELAKRSSEDIELCEIRFNKEDWLDYISIYARGELTKDAKWWRQTDIFETKEDAAKYAEDALAKVLASSEYKQAVSDMWKKLGGYLKKWSDPKQNTKRRTWQSLPMTSRLGSLTYLLKARGQIKMGAKTTPATWVQNVMNDIRKVGQQFAADIKLDKSVIVEHGLLPESSQQKGQVDAFEGPTLPIKEHQRGGGEGNALQTALIKALNTSIGKATKDMRARVMLYLVSDILDQIWASTLDKRKSPTTIQREHIIHLTVLPDESQLGDIDRKIAQSIKKYFAVGGPWEKAAIAYFQKIGIKGSPTNPGSDMNIAVSGSPSFTDEVVDASIRQLVQNVFPHKSTPDMRYKVNRRFKEAIKKSHKTDKLTNKKNKKTTKSAIKAVIFGKAAKGRKPKKSARKRSAATARTAPSPITLRNMLNEVLPQQVARNMVAPALQFRTGRFASSARVGQVIVGPRGGTTIEYTYQRAPYETFEPGGAQGSRNRDPRKIIGQSLREIATGIVGSKFSVRST